MVGTAHAMILQAGETIVFETLRRLISNGKIVVNISDHRVEGQRAKSKAVHRVGRLRFWTIGTPTSTNSSNMMGMTHSRVRGSLSARSAAFCNKGPRVFRTSALMQPNQLVHPGLACMTTLIEGRASLPTECSKPILGLIDGDNAKTGQVLDESDFGLNAPKRKWNRNGKSKETHGNQICSNSCRTERFVVNRSGPHKNSKENGQGKGEARKHINELFSRIGAPFVKTTPPALRAECHRHGPQDQSLHRELQRQAHLRTIVNITRVTFASQTEQEAEMEGVKVQVLF